MDMTIDADSVEVSSGYHGGKDLRAELRNVDENEIVENIFEALWPYEKINLVLKHIPVSEFAENLEGNDREELYNLLREEFE